MNRIILCAVATTAIILSGCKKQEKTVPEAIPTDKKAEQPATMAPSEKPESVTASIQEQAEAVVSTLTVKAEDVLADLNESVDAIKEKASSLEQTDLLAYADQYKTLLLEKKEEIMALTDQVKTLPISEMMGDKAKALKAELSEYSEQFSAMKERYSIYLDQLKAYGVDLSNYVL